MEVRSFVSHFHFLRAEINLFSAFALLEVCLLDLLEHERDYEIPGLLIFKWILFMK